MGQLRITKQIEKQFEKHPFNSQRDKGLDAELLVKFFDPFGAATWLITEAEKTDDGDWLMYGYIHYKEWVWGYASLNGLKSIHVGQLHLERDCLAKGTVKENIR